MPGQSVVAHHLIWTLYGHWLPNDPRGSGSETLREDKFAPLGLVHHGRRPPHSQPSRDALRDFQREAEPLLSHQKLWIESNTREALANAVRERCRSRSYTVWGCAILANHMHMIVRRHRDDAATIWQHLADCGRQVLRERGVVAADHPVWSDRPYKVFLFDEQHIRTCIRYVEQNPVEEGLPPQRWDFVTEYDGWPWRKA